MRRVGKIGRRKVFPEVKNVNAKSPKKTLKIVGFFQAVVESKTMTGLSVKESASVILSLL